MNPLRAVSKEVPVAIASLLLATLFVPPVFAVDVRQPDVGSHYEAGLVRAYAQCLTPNTTAFGGQPACSPAVTSVCGYGPASIGITGWDDFPPYAFLTNTDAVVSGPCNLDDWVMQFGLRISAEEAPQAELPCPSGRCTIPDMVEQWDMQYGVHGFFALPFLYFWNCNFEVHAIRIVDHDGVPIVATGVGSPADARYVSNLTVPYPACPADGCDIQPWTSPCDFETGEIEWTRDPSTTAARVHATLRDVTGTSPLCTTGAYQLQATVRPTVYGCGNPASPTLCTLVDQPVAVSLQAKGRKLDADGLVHVGDYQYASMEVLESRLLDPTGAVVASPGVTGVRPMPSTSIAVKGNSLKLRAWIHIHFQSVDPIVSVDPIPDGLTVTLSDRDGVAWQVALPSERWQLQPPIGERWDYVDENGILGGVRKARLKRVTKKGVVQGYQLDLFAKGADLSAADFPGFTLGIDVSSTSTLGGVAVLMSESHRTCKGTAGKYTCK